MAYADYSADAIKAASQYNIPQNLFLSLVNKESGWNAYAMGTAGEIGLTQLKPGTASDLGVNPWNPTENLLGGAKYLAQMYQKFGNWYDALRGYNQGATGASKDNKKGAEYAASIISASGMELPSASQSTTATNSSTANSGGGMFETAKNWILEKWVVVVIILIIAALAFFGFQAMVKE